MSAIDSQVTLGGARTGAPTSALPKPDNPFFIVAPPYTRTSAGVTVLHLLCHYLNLCGESAFIVQYPPEQMPIRSLPAYVSAQGGKEFPGGMIAPLITQDVLDYFDSLQLTPVVIYPEVFDNPLSAPFFGRYILNYPGKLNTKYQQRENFSLAYTRVLAEYCAKEYPLHPAVEDVWFVPTADLEFWNMSGAQKVRSGTCFYAGKMKSILGFMPLDVPSGSVEILRSRAMSREQIRNIFWKSEAFYCYEDTALAIEAQLCGCPTVFVKNKQFSGDPLASIELGQDGSCKLDEQWGLQRAKASIEAFTPRIMGYIDAAPKQVAPMAKKWKTMAKEHLYQGTIRYPLEPRLVFFDRKWTPASSFVDDDLLPDNALLLRNALGRPRRCSLATLSNIALGSFALFLTAVREVGVAGTLRRIVRGLLHHGPVGFFRILHRAGASTSLAS